VHWCEIFSLLTGRNCRGASFFLQHVILLQKNKRGSEKWTMCPATSPIMHAEYRLFYAQRAWLGTRTQRWAPLIFSVFFCYVSSGSAHIKTIAIALAWYIRVGLWVVEWKRISQKEPMYSVLVIETNTIDNDDLKLWKMSAMVKFVAIDSELQCQMY